MRQNAHTHFVCNFYLSHILILDFFNVSSSVPKITTTKKTTCCYCLYSQKVRFLTKISVFSFLHFVLTLLLSVFLSGCRVFFYLFKCILIVFLWNFMLDKHTHTHTHWLTHTYIHLITHTFKHFQTLDYHIVIVLCFNKLPGLFFVFQAFKSLSMTIKCVCVFFFVQAHVAVGGSHSENIFVKNLQKCITDMNEWKLSHAPACRECK